MSAEALTALWLLVWLGAGCFSYVSIRIGIHYFRRVWGYLYNKANPPHRFRTTVTMDRTTNEVARSFEQVS